jgi:hypothetical protein
VQIFLLGEAVSLKRKSVAGAVVPVGWPPLEQTLTKVAERHVQIGFEDDFAGGGTIADECWRSK